MLRHLRSKQLSADRPSHDLVKSGKQSTETDHGGHGKLIVNHADTVQWSTITACHRGQGGLCTCDVGH